jgi:hypothetical protein
MISENRLQRFLSNPLGSGASTINRPRLYDPRNRRPERAGYTGELVPASDFLLPPGSALSQQRYDRPPSKEEVLFHVALFERLAELRRSRRSLWSRILGFIRQC